MMKKRILASSMASVMALSSVSVVAFADEKTKDYGEAVTKAELEAYLESLESFVDEKLDDYGFVQGEDLTSAIAHANTVLDDDRSKATDYAAAYQMVKSVKDNLRIYSATELKALVKQWKGAYDSENVLNKSIGDAVYKQTTFDTFAEAYDDAEANVDSEDARSITDAYLALEKAADKLEKLGTVTKAEFRKAHLAYEALEAKMADYEPWRRGTVSEKPSTGKKADLTKVSLEFKELCDIVYNDSVYDAEACFTYWDGKDWAEVNKGSNNFYISTKIQSYRKSKGTTHTTTTTTTTTYNALYKDLKSLYEDFDKLAGVTETSNTNYIEATKIMNEAVKIFNSWKPDNLKSGTKSSASSVEKKYHAQLVETFNSKDPKMIEDKVVTWADSESNPLGYKISFDTDKHTMKTNKTFYMIIDKNTGYMVPLDETSVTAEKVLFADIKSVQAAVDAANNGIKDTTTSDAVAEWAKSNGTTVAYATITMSTNIYDKLEYEAKMDSLVDAFEAKENGLTKPTSNVIEGSDTFFTAIKDVIGGNTDKVYKKYTAGTGASGDEIEAVRAYNAGLDELKDFYDYMVSAQTTVGELEYIMNMYNTYKDLDFQSADTKEGAKATATAIMDALTEGGPQLQTINGSSKEWTLIWRKMSYALDDMFPVGKKTDRTLAKLYSLIEKSIDATEKTGDSAAFDKLHMAAVTARQDAYAFYKAAKALGKNYDESDAVAVGFDSKTLDGVYAALDTAVKNLNKVYEEFEYSYEDIRTAIGTYAIAFDDGEVKGDALKKAINKCAYDLSVLEASSFEDGGDVTNYAFDEDGNFQPANRLKTKKNDKVAKTDPNQFEKNLKASYEAMVKAYDEAKNGKTSTVKNDFNGDGKFTSDDLLDALSAFTASTTDTKYDANGDGKFTTDDLLVILADFTAQA